MIGIVTGVKYDYARKAMLEGIASQAENHDFDISVISDIYSHTHTQDIIEKVKTFDLMDSSSLDGIIVLAETISENSLRQMIFEKLSNINIPSVVVGENIDGFTCVNSDVRADFRDIARHLTELHGYTDIDIITAHKENPGSAAEVLGVRDIFEEKGIPLNESNVICGDSRVTSGAKAAAEYISGKRRLPQAIICANDFIAFGLIDTLGESDITMGKDVAVVGYEYVGERCYHYPILTTYSRSRYNMGVKSANLLISIINNTDSDDIPLNGFMITGNTCPCGCDMKYLQTELQGVRRQRGDDMNFTRKLEYKLAVCHTLGEYIAALQESSCLLRDINGLYLCLYENWLDKKSTAQPHEGADDEIVTLYHLAGQSEISAEPRFITGKTLISEVLSGSDEKKYLNFVPIFADGIDIGCFIFHCSYADCHTSTATDWINSAANALNLLCMKNDINEQLKSEKLSAFRDAVTGVYNREGLVRELKNAASKAVNSEKLTAVILKTCIFSDKSRADEKSISAKLDIEAAECMQKLFHNASVPIRRLAEQTESGSIGDEKSDLRESLKESFGTDSNINIICARLSDGLFVYAVVGNQNESCHDIIIDRLTNFIFHSPVYKSTKETYFILSHGVTVDASGAEPEKIVQLLTEEIGRKTDDMRKMCKAQNFAGFNGIRCAMYRYPEKKWDAEKECRDMHLSCGHFRAAYKKLFGVSFHRDLIHSRISLAKYLLISTSLSLHVIALKCGYEDDKYFLRQFRQNTGVSPNAYRKSDMT